MLKLNCARNEMWQQNQDAIVNGLGNGTLEQGSDEWYALFKKGDDLLAMKDAYNRGMMGQLDGEKAQTAEEQAEAATTGGGTKPGMDDGEEENQTPDEQEEDSNPISDFLGNFPENILGTISDAGKWVFDAVTGGVKWVQDNAEAIKDVYQQAEEEGERILETPLGELTLEELEKRKELEIEQTEEELEKLMEDELSEYNENSENYLVGFTKDALNNKYNRILDNAVKEIEERFAKYEDEIEEKAPENGDVITDTSGIKLTYNVLPLTNRENEDATLHGEVSSSKVIETREEANEIFSSIINGRYDGFNGLGFIEKVTDLTPLDFINLEEIPKRTRGYDAFGRPVYIEVGYEIMTFDRTFSIDDQMLCEIEYFIYDNEGKEVLHDCYIEILKNF